MKKLFVSVLMIACAFVAQAANVPQATVDGAGSISGTITDVVTGEPIVGAKVMAGCCRNAVTGGDGTYTIADVPPGTYTVTAVKPREYEKVSYPEQVTVEAGQQVTGIDIALKPMGGGGGEGSISGFVYDKKSGEPIAGAKVVAGCQAYALTGDDGAYTIAKLADGTYAVKASKKGYECAIYPDPVVIENGEPVEGIDFYLEPKLQDALY